MRSSSRSDRPVSSSHGKDSSPGTNLRRRGFLLTLGVGGAGAAALAARSLTGADPTSASPAASTPTDGYKMTDHIRRYYRTAKI